MPRAATGLHAPKTENAKKSALALVQAVQSGVRPDAVAGDSDTDDPRDSDTVTICESALIGAMVLTD